MCYSTKKKIADCVRQLMKRKEISKITIGDIMEATGMSRQSFYYHFKDIYDVLEWIGCNDFKDQLQGQYDSMEKWACDLMEVLQRERSFYEKLANELAWPMIVRGVRMALDAQEMCIRDRYSMWIRVSSSAALQQGRSSAIRRRKSAFSSS